MICFTYPDCSDNQQGTCRGGNRDFDRNDKPIAAFCYATEGGNGVKCHSRGLRHRRYGAGLSALHPHDL